MMNRFRLLWKHSVCMPVLLTAFLYGAFILLRLWFHDFNPTAFIVGGDLFCDAGRVPAHFLVLKDSAGYDGQYYYRLALNPFTAGDASCGVRFDFSSYRHQRIAYPLLVWLFSAGKAEYVPAMMILVNYLFLCGIAWLGGWYAKAFNMPVLWGLIIPLYPGFLLTLSRDLTEITAAFFVLAGFVLLKKSKPNAAACLLSLGVFAKETALLAALGSGLVYCRDFFKHRRRSAVPWCFFAAPVLCYCLWHLFLFFYWGILPSAGGVQNLGPPFAGMARFIAALLPPSSAAAQLYLAELLFIGSGIAAAALTVRKSAADAHIKISWLLYGLLMVLLTQLVWCEDWGFLRAYTECGILGAVIVLGSNSSLLQPFFIYETCIWLGLFLVRIFYV
jgi:hypothetical protein